MSHRSGPAPLSRFLRRPRFWPHRSANPSRSHRCRAIRYRPLEARASLRGCRGQPPRSPTRRHSRDTPHSRGRRECSRNRVSTSRRVCRSRRSSFPASKPRAVPRAPWREFRPPPASAVSHVPILPSLPFQTPFSGAAQISALIASNTSPISCVPSTSRSTPCSL